MMLKKHNKTFYNTLAASVILVLFNASPLDISWAKANPRVKSVIEAFYPAQVSRQCCHRLA